MRITVVVGLTFVAGALAATPSVAQESPAVPPPATSEDPSTSESNWIPIQYVPDVPEYGGQAHLNVDFADFPGAQRDTVLLAWTVGPPSGLGTQRHADGDRGSKSRRTEVFDNDGSS